MAGNAQVIGISHTKDNRATPTSRIANAHEVFSLDSLIWGMYRLSHTI
jgi:hypothetical protein